MSSHPTTPARRAFQERAHADLIDSYDEELEMELDDDRLDDLLMDLPAQGPVSEGAFSRASL